MAHNSGGQWAAARITQPLGEVRSFAKMGNMYCKTCIAEGVTPKEFKAKKMEDFMLLFPFGINVGAAGDQRVVLQFEFSGDVNDTCYSTIEKGKVAAKLGIYERPDLTITAFQVWMDIMTRKEDGGQMLMEQKYKVHGDLMLMMKLFQSQKNV
jgi:hypothetical protein